MLKKIKNIAEYLLLRIIFFLLSFFSLKTTSRIGGFIARKVGPMLKAHSIARRNLKKILPNLSKKKRNKILDKMWDNLGRTSAEFFHILNLTGKEYRNLITLEGEKHLDHIKELQLKGQSAILISGHFANWEICAKTAYEYGCPISVIYRKANNPYVEKMITKVRNQYQTSAIPKNKLALRQIVELFKQGKPMGALLDQKASDGILIPFLGAKAYTAPALIKLALKYKAPLYPVEVIRINNSVKFKVIIHEPMAMILDPNKNEDENVKDILIKINNELGKFILANPEQWFWVHRRWGKWK